MKKVVKRIKPRMKIIAEKKNKKSDECEIVLDNSVVESAEAPQREASLENQAGGILVPEPPTEIETRGAAMAGGAAAGRGGAAGGDAAAGAGGDATTRGGNIYSASSENTEEDARKYTAMVAQTRRRIAQMTQSQESFAEQRLTNPERVELRRSEMGNDEKKYYSMEQIKTQDRRRRHPWER